MTLNLAKNFLTMTLKFDFYLNPIHLGLFVMEFCSVNGFLRFEHNIFPSMLVSIKIGSTFNIEVIPLSLNHEQGR